jgi:hypothetical protein
MLLVSPVHFGLIGIASAFITQTACACDGTRLTLGDSASRVPTHAQAKISDHNEAGSELSHCNSVKRNLIWNGDLERGTSGEPQGWSPTSWGKLSAKFLYPVVGCRGDRAVEVVVTHRHSGDAEWRFTHNSTSNDRVYGFSDEYNSDVVTNVTVEYKLSITMCCRTAAMNTPSRPKSWNVSSIIFDTAASVVTLREGLTNLNGESTHASAAP